MDAVEVRRSSRARQWRLEVPWGKPARLTVPRWTSRSEIERLLAEKGPWIDKQRRRHAPRLGLEELAVSESDARTSARELVSALAEEEAVRIGVSYQRIRIGGQRTLWGSCSARGTLSFNWRLVLAPLEVLDYVVVHELCHLRVPDHSPRFWTLVERHRPHWRQQRDWLREQGPELLAFRPSNNSTSQAPAPNVTRLEAMPETTSEWSGQNRRPPQRAGVSPLYGGSSPRLGSKGSSHRHVCCRDLAEVRQRLPTTDQSGCGGSRPMFARETPTVRIVVREDLLVSRQNRLEQAAEPAF